MRPWVSTTIAGICLAAAIAAGVWGWQSHNQADALARQLTAVQQQVAQVRQTAQQQVARAQQQAVQAQQQLTQLQSANETRQTELDSSIKQTLTQTFTTLFAYDNKTYASRFERVKDVVAPSVLAKFMGSGGAVQAPSTPIQSSVERLDIYLSGVTPSEAHAIVSVTSVYAVNHVKMQPNTVLYQLTLQQQSGKWVITDGQALSTYQTLQHP